MYSYTFSDGEGGTCISPLESIKTENNKVEQDLIVCEKPLLFFYYHLLKNPLILILPNDMYLPCHQNIFRCHFTDYVSSNGKN